MYDLSCISASFSSKVQFLRISFYYRLTGRDVYVEDRLFATLDTSLHIYRLPSGFPILLADTIGFISNLPTQLLASFQATLSHVANAVS